MVGHTSKMPCGRIGSHKSPDCVTAKPAEPAVVPGAMHVLLGTPRCFDSAGQLRHVAAVHASDCTIDGRGAYTTVHQQALFTRPSSMVRATLQGSVRLPGS